MVAKDGLINFAIENSGLGPVKSSEQISVLGEGAWHHAYLVTYSRDERYVVRIPKEVSVYGHKVEFDEKAIHAEYGGTKLYYKVANKVMPGICPEFFHYVAEPGKTYTIESYKGKNIKLAEITKKGAFNTGYQTGEFFREMNNAGHTLKGFGYLTWNGSELEGQFQTDASVFMQEESEEYARDFETVMNWDKRFNNEELRSKLEACLTNRSIDNHSISFTNQDTSPENILWNDGKVSIIDPFPILYYGHSLAGNFMNCYEAIFPTYYNTKRYAAHQFDKYTEELNGIAEGYLHGYADGDQHIKQLVKREQYIHLVNLVFEHYQAATGKMTRRTEVGMGTKNVIHERISKLLQKMQAFKLE